MSEHAPSLYPDLNDPATRGTTKADYNSTQPHVNHFIATSAFECVAHKEVDISNILQDGGYEGKYAIQVGFDEELLCLEDTILQEIYLSLIGRLSHRVAQKIADCLYPFPVHICASNKEYHFRTGLSSIELRGLWASCGIYQTSTDIQNPNTTSPPAEENKASGPPGDKGTSRQNGDEGTGRGNPNWKGKQPARDNPGDTHTGGDRDGDDSANSDSANQPEASKHAARIVKDIKVHLPFESLLKCHADFGMQEMSFQTEAALVIEVSSGSCRPDTPSWPYAWTEIDVTCLSSSVTPPGKYALNMSHIRISFSGCPSSVLKHTPDNSTSKPDIKTKKEHRTSARLRATLGLTPSVTLGNTSREEDQPEWTIALRTNPFDTKNGMPQNTVTWDFVHNNHHPSRNSFNSIGPTPNMVFALTGGQTQAPPVLEVNVLMQYSLPSSPQPFRTWFAQQSASATDVPVYTNILHQASVILDMGDVESGPCEYPEGLKPHNSEDYRSMGEKGPRPSPVMLELRNPFHVSACEVPLSQILIGHVTSSRKNPLHKALVLVKNLLD